MGLVIQRLGIESPITLVSFLRGLGAAVPRRIADNEVSSQQDF
jgi:hypothetical protein